MTVALAGLAALAVAMGIGRFAFTPLLPMMQADAGLSLAQGGWLASANYAGYLAGALWATVQPVRPAVAIRAGLLAIALATLGMGLGGGLLAWALLRAVAGVASAWVLVHVSAWCLERLAPLRRPFLNGVVYAGVGAGVAAAGLACLLLMAASRSSRDAWMTLGVLSLAVCAALWRIFGASTPPPTSAPETAPWRRDWTKLVVCYGAYGFGYIIPATFIPVIARESAADPTVFGWAWPLFGAAAAASTLAVTVFQGRLNDRQVWMMCHFVMAFGVAAPLAMSGLPGILTTAVCVGSTFTAITMLAMQEARRIAGAYAPRLMGAMTAAFAAGQILGPASVTAWLHAGADIQAALASASVILLASALLLVARRAR
jgi:MFS family permease